MEKEYIEINGMRFKTEEKKIAVKTGKVYIIEENISLANAKEFYEINNFDPKFPEDGIGRVLTDGKRAIWFVSNEFFADNYKIIEDEKIKSEVSEALKNNKDFKKLNEKLSNN